MIAISSVAVLATVIVVRIVWVFVFAYLPRMLFKRVREREPAPTPAQVFVVAWAGMRGVVSLAAAFGVPMTTLSGAPFPGRPQLVFLTFVVVIGTLLLHGLTLPWLIRRLGVQGDEARTDAIAAAAAQDKAARAAAERLDELLAEEEVTDVHERAADVLRGWNTRRRNSAWERLGRDEEEIGESPAVGVPAAAAGNAGGRTRDVHRRARQRADRRRSAAGGAPRARPRGGDAQPWLNPD